MKTISLTNSDELVLVDDEDYDYLIQWNWQLTITKTNKFISRCKTISLDIKIAIIISREIAKRMGLDLSNDIDHIDRNSLNNCRSNLRSATRSQNVMNSGLRKNNSTGYKGVTFNIKSQKYYAQINYKGNRIHLGSFDDPIEAAYTYDHYAKRYFGYDAGNNE